MAKQRYFTIFALWLSLLTAVGSIQQASAQAYPYQEYKPNRPRSEASSTDEDADRSFLSTPPRSYTTLTYQIGVPGGKTQEFINSTSFRGIGAELGAYLTPQFSLGISGNWNVFYKAMGVQTVELDEANTISGEQFRYINAFPILAKGNYYFRKEDSKIWPYAGVGVGAQYAKYEMDVGSVRLASSGWQFAVAPEAGVQVRLKDNLNFTANLRYHYAPSTSKLDAYSAVNFNIGLTFTR